MHTNGLDRNKTTPAALANTGGILVTSVICFCVNHCSCVQAVLTAYISL